MKSKQKRLIEGIAAFLSAGILCGILACRHFIPQKEPSSIDEAAYCHELLASMISYKIIVPPEVDDSSEHPQEAEVIITYPDYVSIMTELKSKELSEEQLIEYLFECAKEERFKRTLNVISEVKQDSSGWVLVSEKCLEDVLHGQGEELLLLRFAEMEHIELSEIPAFPDLDGLMEGIK